jgi:hypothetical protein
LKLLIVRAFCLLIGFSSFLVPHQTKVRIVVCIWCLFAFSLPFSSLPDKKLKLSIKELSNIPVCFLVIANHSIP